MRVDMPPPPRWFKITQGPERLPFRRWHQLSFPLAVGLMFGSGWPALMGIAGLALIWVGLIVAGVSIVGQMVARRWARRYFATEPGQQAIAEAERRDRAARETAAESADWLSKAVNGEASPFTQLGFDSDVGLMLVIRRDQRVPGHDDKWIAQVLPNTKLPQPDRLPYGVAAFMLHDIAHSLMETHEEQTAGTVEVPTQ